MAIGPIDPDAFLTTDPGIHAFHLLRRQKPSTSTDNPTGMTTIPGVPGGPSAIGPHGLDEMYVKFSDKNIKDGLSSFLPDLPGYIDAPGTGDTSLQSLIDKPPVGGRELVALSDTALQGFFLMPGSVPDQYKFQNRPPEKKKKKKHKHHDNEHSSAGGGGGGGSAGGSTITAAPGESLAERKQRKRKMKEEAGGGGTKKEKKKRKKRKSISSS